MPLDITDFFYNEFFFQYNEEFLQFLIEYSLNFPSNSLIKFIITYIDVLNMYDIKYHLCNYLRVLYLNIDQGCIRIVSGLIILAIFFNIYVKLC